MKAKLNERKFTSQIMKEIKSHNCFVHKIAERFASGFPDLIVINKKGKVMFIEVKVGSNKPTKLQAHFMDLINEHRGFAFLITQCSQDNIEVLEWDGLKTTYAYDNWLQQNIR